MGETGGACPRCGTELAADRRIHEPDLPAMGPHPSDDWIAVWQPADAAEALEVQEFLEELQIPALQLPAWADWTDHAPEERDQIVHVAVPGGPCRRSAPRARRAPRGLAPRAGSPRTSQCREAAPGSPPGNPVGCVPNPRTGVPPASRARSLPGLFATLSCQRPPDPGR